jgi:guanylate kinase
MIHIKTPNLEYQAAIQATLDALPLSGCPTLLVFSGPSGVGKGTLLETLKTGKSNYGTGYQAKPWDHFATTISATTRMPRSGEIDGVHYHFLSQDEFQAAVDDHEFLEYKRSGSGDWYGTLHSEIARICALGKLPVLEIETEGKKEVEAVANAFRIISVFIHPPLSPADDLLQHPELYTQFATLKQYPEELQRRIITLYERLATRNSEDLSLRIKRLQKAVQELSEAPGYTFELTNTTVGQCVPCLQLIFEAALRV